MSLFKRNIGKVMTNSDTGTQNAWAPGLISGINTVLWDGSSNLSLNGIDGTGIAKGTTLTILSTNTTVGRNVVIANMSGSASVGNKILGPSAASISAAHIRGYTRLYYDGTIWQLIDHEHTTGFAPTFSAGNYTAQTAGTWTVASGDVTSRYKQSPGRLVHVQMNIATTTVAQSGGEPTALRVTVSAITGATSNVAVTVIPCRISDNGTPVDGYMTFTAGGSTFDIKKIDDSQFATSSDNTGVWADFLLEMS